MPLWIIVTQWVSRLVLVVLFGLSIWSVSIMIERRRVYKKLSESDSLDEARKLIASRDFTRLEQWSTSREGLRAGTLRAAMSSGLATESIDRAVRSYLTTERAKLERGLTTLATLGSNAPFIGLFGTVMGIIQAFGALSNSQAAASSVMTGISEALVATAVGLFVAIPAVVAYNVFTRKLRVMLADCEALRDDLVARARSEDMSHGR